MLFFLGGGGLNVKSNERRDVGRDGDMTTFPVTSEEVHSVLIERLTASTFSTGAGAGVSPSYALVDNGCDEFNAHLMFYNNIALIS